MNLAKQVFEGLTAANERLIAKAESNWKVRLNMSTIHTPCHTLAEKLEILKRAHLNLPAISPDYMPEDLYAKRSELYELMLRYIWQWSDEVAAKAAAESEEIKE